MAIGVLALRRFGLAGRPPKFAFSMSIFDGVCVRGPIRSNGRKAPEIHTPYGWFIDRPPTGGSGRAGDRRRRNRAPEVP